MNKGTINLSSTKTFVGKKKEYELNDTNICSIQVPGNIKIALIENEKGKFVDLRRYYNGFPTKRGVRLEAIVFKNIVEELKGELNKIK